jgi:hypothetical protein
MGADVGSLVNVGAVRNAVFDYRYDKVSVKSDNAGTIMEAIRNEECGMAADLMEVNLEKLASFYAGVLAHATVAAAPVAVTNEEHVLTGTTENILTYRNGAGTEVATISATSVSGGGTTYVRDCDYVINVNADGYTTIARAYPTVIEGATALCAVTGTTNYFLSAGAWDVQPAVGDHIYVTGFTETANNGVKTVTAVTADTITVSEVLVNEVEGDTITITRGAILTGGTVYVNYTYTPLASRTLKGGGLTEFTARVCRFTNTDSAGKTLAITIFSSTPESGFTFNFPSDDGDDPMLCPIAMTGKPDTSRAAGEQLFEIVDTQHSS